MLFRSKTLDAAFELIENMASHHFQWTNERSSTAKPGMYQLSSQDALAAQVEILTKTIAQMQSTQGSVVSAVQTLQQCQICGNSGHNTSECPTICTAESSVQTTSEVNYTQSQGPFSQSYNPEWRQHPNFSYKNNSLAGSTFSSSVSHPNFKQQQNSYGGSKNQESTSTLEKIIEKQMEMIGTLSNSIQNLASKVDNITADRKSVV